MEQSGYQRARGYPTQLQQRVPEDGEIQRDVQNQVDDDQEFERVCIVAAKVVYDNALGGIAEHEVSHQSHHHAHAQS